jgi:hypothetical protein
MTTHAKESISAQAAGALGEKAVEAELLRRNWIPANVNATVKNAKDFDIFALKSMDKRVAYIRVKTCRPNKSAFLCKPITAEGICEPDFTIAVRMGNRRKEDQFYIVPTKVVREEINKRQADHKGRRKDIGMWRLSFSERRDKKEEAGRGIEKKWSRYLDKWDLLEG